MTATHAELLQAVHAAPDDDEPRLVLADWLLERDEPRGEFITTQLALTGKGLSPPTRKKFEKRGKALLTEHQATWTALCEPLKAKRLDYKDGAIGHWRFRRGFIESLIVDASALLDHWEALWAIEPVVHLKVMKSTIKFACALAESPLLARLHRLTLRGKIGDRGAAALAASPHVAGLRRLNLRGTGITHNGAESLAGSAYLRPHMLALTDNEIGDDGAAALAGSPVLSSIQRLYLSRTEIGDDGVVALARSPHVGNLTALGLGTLEELTDTGAKALLDSTTLSSLVKPEFDLCDEISPKMLKRLRKRWPKMRPREYSW